MLLDSNISRERRRYRRYGGVFTNILDKCGKWPCRLVERAISEPDGCDNQPVICQCRLAYFDRGGILPGESPLSDTAPRHAGNMCRFTPFVQVCRQVDRVDFGLWVD